MGEIPEKIYLQWYGDVEGWEAEADENTVSMNEVTWCADKIFDVDIEYVKLEKLQATETRVQKLEAVLRPFADVDVADTSGNHEEYRDALRGLFERDAFAAAREALGESEA